MNIDHSFSQRMVQRSGWLFGSFLCLCLLAGTAARASERAALPRTYFQDVVDKARQSASRLFQSPGKDLPDVLKKIGYDEWRDIRYDPARSLWAPEKDPFTVQFFHPGFLYQHPVTVHYVDKSGTHPFPFSTGLFDYSRSALKDKVPGDPGFAGFRVHYPLNTSKYADELVSFLGASYFRALGKGLAYGLSARGLAVDTAVDTGEEFPLFREFWILRPASGAKAITLYALLDSDSVAGAYEFVITPGDETRMEVHSVLFMRRKVAKLGVAPLTSMFFYGENGGLKGDADFRPEVHDSDGLLIQAGTGEWIWHPVINPERLLINSFGGGQPLGFGLIQRDTDFDHYQDLEARYHRRPSVWVEPQGDWGKGRLELVQLPTPSEYNDNIVAYWVPEKEPEAGESVRFACTLFWHSAEHRRVPEGFVTATRIMRRGDAVTFLLDFTGGTLPQILSADELTADVQAFNGYRIASTQVMRNPETSGYRVVFTVPLEKAGLFKDMLPDQRPAAEMRVLLKKGAIPVTETWSYTFLP